MMRKKSRTIFNFSATLVLLGSLVIAGYYLSNNETIFTQFFPKFAEDYNEQNKIVNQPYNKAIEGTVFDNIYDFTAKVIPVRTEKTLHKTAKKDMNLYIASDKLTLEAKFSNKKATNQPDTHLYMNIPDIQKTKSDENFRFLSSQNIHSGHRPLSIYQIPTTRINNRFEGLLKEFKKGYKEIKAGKKTPAQRRYLSGIKNWNSNLSKALTENKKTDKILNLQDPFSKTDKEISMDDYRIQFASKPSSLKLNMVKDFSKDPLETVIKKILIPGGLPKTAANVDAVARGMGLPSGALGDKSSLATSLGLSLEELSDPNSKLPSEIVLSINKNESYIGNKLDINNTTLSDYYENVLKSKYFSTLNNP
jgi:hypothetical protein